VRTIITNDNYESRTIAVSDDVGEAFDLATQARSIHSTVRALKRLIELVCSIKTNQDEKRVLSLMISLLGDNVRKYGQMLADC
jgi:thioredoxin-like negative regulator of GroEL